MKYIIIHCSATKAGKDFRKADIDRWHRQQGWDGCGYHYVIDLDGTIEQGRAETQPGAHCSGYNSCSIGVCYIGGLDNRGHPCDTRTPAQRQSLQRLIDDLHSRYPEAAVVGHRDLNPKKECPGFEVRKAPSPLKGSEEGVT